MFKKKIVKAMHYKLTVLQDKVPEEAGHKLMR